MANHDHAGGPKFLHGSRLVLFWLFAMTAPALAAQWYWTRDENFLYMLFACVVTAFTLWCELRREKSGNEQRPLGEDVPKN